MGRTREALHPRFLSTGPWSRHKAGSHTTTINALHDTAREAERNIVPLVALLLSAKTEHARFIAEQAPDCRWGQSPHLGKVLHAVVPLRERHEFPVIPEPLIDFSIDPQIVSYCQVIRIVPLLHTASIRAVLDDTRALERMERIWKVNAVRFCGLAVRSGKRGNYSETSRGLTPFWRLVSFENNC